MNKDNEKQLLTTGVYEAPKCEVIEMMGEGALLDDHSGVVDGGEIRRGDSWSDDEDEF